MTIKFPKFVIVSIKIFTTSEFVFVLGFLMNKLI